jgi:hypothetical protein
MEETGVLLRHLQQTPTNSSSSSNVPAGGSSSSAEKLHASHSSVTSSSRSPLLHPTPFAAVDAIWKDEEQKVKYHYAIIEVRLGDLAKSGARKVSEPGLFLYSDVRVDMQWYSAYICRACLSSCFERPLYYVKHHF